MDRQWIITGRALDRFIERAPGALRDNRQGARTQFLDAIESAELVENMRSPGGGHIWRLPSRGGVFVVVRTIGGRQVAITVLGSGMSALCDREGGPNTAQPGTLVSRSLAARLELASEEQEVAEAAVKQLHEALGAKDPGRVPEEFWGACVEAVKDGAARMALVQVAQGELAKVREVEKTLRHAIAQDADNRHADLKQRIREVLREAFLKPTPREIFDFIAASSFSGLVEELVRPAFDAPGEEVRLLRGAKERLEADLLRERTARKEAEEEVASMREIAAVHATARGVTEAMDAARQVRREELPPPTPLPTRIVVEHHLVFPGVLEALGLRTQAAAPPPERTPIDLGKPDPLTPAQSLRHHRERLGLSQRQLSVRLCVGQSSVCCWENGRRPIPAKVLHQVRRMK